MFGGGGRDPFGNPFEQVHRQMRQMDNMMNGLPLMNAMIGDAFNMLDSFGMGQPRHPMLTDDHPMNNHRGMRHPAEAMMMSPFGPGGFGGFGGPLLGGMLGQMHNLHDRALNDPNSVVFSESTMISFDPSGQPKVVQASTRKAGNVKETRKALRDGDRAEMSIGHHMGDKTHIVEKKRDKDGNIRQEQRFINLAEDEAPAFNERFKSQARENLGGLAGLFGGAGRRQHNALENGGGRGRPGTGRSGAGGGTSSSSAYRHNHHHNSNETSTPIVTIPDDDDEEEPEIIRRGRHNGNGRNGNNHRYNRYDDDIDIVYSNRGTGPTIQEIHDDTETDTKRRKGVFGKFMG